MKRALMIIMTIAILAGLGMSVCQRILVINCNYSFDKVTPTFDYSDILHPKLNIDADIKVENPNEVDVIIDKLDMDFYANDEVIFDGSPTPGDTIPAEGEGIFTIPMSIQLSDLTAAIIDAIKEGGVSYKLAGQIYFNTRVGEYDFPITVTEGEI